jgi:hypothetical protein
MLMLRKVSRFYKSKFQVNEVFFFSYFQTNEGKEDACVLSNCAYYSHDIYNF